MERPDKLRLVPVHVKKVAAPAQEATQEVAVRVKEEGRTRAVVASRETGQSDADKVRDPPSTSACVRTRHDPSEKSAVAIRRNICTFFFERRS
jgi:hypothetical protein